MKHFLRCQVLKMHIFYNECNKHTIICLGKLRSGMQREGKVFYSSCEYYKLRMLKRMRQSFKFFFQELQ